MMISRRWRPFLGAAATLCLLACLVPPAAAQPDEADGPIVTTEYGKVRGTWQGATAVFQGIPYAAPPTGKLRWRKPARPQPWEGVRDATKPPPACPQHPGEVPEGSKSEDCLYLTVTTPVKRSAKPRAVLVWVHGGGFFMGTGSNYDAKRLAARGDIVVVTVNYRLGVFGFFAHPGLAGSGTFGLQDQQAALKWVRRNIAAFGGDPRNVTVAGQSAGAMSVCAQLTSPSARGLFDKAIMQSGSCGYRWRDNYHYRNEQASSIFQPVDVMRQRGAATAAQLGCEGDPRTVLECLRKLPVDRLMSVQQHFIQPAYGTATLPVEPEQAIRKGLFNRVPVLSGSTKDEATSWTSVYDAGKPMSETTYRTVLQETFGDDADTISERYPLHDYPTPANAWAAIVTDDSWACSQYRITRRLAERVPVYHYEFADPSPPPLGPEPGIPTGAQHASELWYFFDLLGMAPPLTEDQRKLAEQMIDYWASFVTSGAPDATAGSVPWPRMRPGQSTGTQQLAPGSGQIHQIDFAAAHQCGFWSQLP
ncbi:MULTISPECIES: carboxylesterase/lipase family protein [Thermocrispum]|uniref:carboxylesterase/lipase family protein n=1 Tax=Thermocrispum TaxID=37924 RepID=UPI00041B4831|nr:MULTISPECIES: carboxylesterase/lipase family protein [Thermocrispum]